MKNKQGEPCLKFDWGTYCDTTMPGCGQDKPLTKGALEDLATELIAGAYGAVVDGAGETIADGLIGKLHAPDGPFSKVDENLMKRIYKYASAFQEKTVDCKELNPKNLFGLC